MAGVMHQGLVGHAAKKKLHGGYVRAACGSRLASVADAYRGLGTSPSTALVCSRHTQPSMLRLYTCRRTHMYLWGHPI